MNETEESPPREHMKMVLDILIMLSIITLVIGILGLIEVISIVVGVNEYVDMVIIALGGILGVICCIIRLKIGILNRYIKILMITWVVIILCGGIIFLVLLIYFS